MADKIVVACDGSGDFLTIQDALQTAGDEVYIELKPGIYYGQIFSIKKKLTIKGYNPEKTIITGKIGAKDVFEDGNTTGTFRTYTAYFAGESITLENLIIENTAGQGTEAGQAIALYASASFVYCKNVRILGFQDTLFTGPLPEKERIPGGFCGPEEKLPRRPSVQLYENCCIAGTVDFIFGGADALFKNCTIAVRRTTTECYITAPSTIQDGTGYVFDSCRIEKYDEFEQKSVPTQLKVFLARPWRQFAKCCWLNSDFSDVICRESWDNWDNAENEKTIFFSVYNNTWSHEGIAGKGSCRFVKVLDKKQADIILSKAEEICRKVKEKTGY